MAFLWFWAFWHWTTESYRVGSLLRSPIDGIGGHWDEWFRFEASPEERRAIEDAGRSSRTQRQFIRWIVRHWATEAEWRGHRPSARFVLAQLATLRPFDGWSAFSRYRQGFGVGGIAAVVLTEGSLGESADVRVVEALALPADTTAPASIPEGFNTDDVELERTREATMSLLRGKGLVRLLALWVACGRRPYPRGLAVALTLGWLAVGAMIVWMIAGPDPAERLVLMSVVLMALWVALVLTAVGVAAALGIRAWRFGKVMGRRLDESHVHLRMDGGLTLIGGSAGLPFCLNTLLSVYRSTPRVPVRSWLWTRLLHRMRSDMRSWAATGVVMADGRIRPVVLAPKLRACVRHERIMHVLTPNQRDASNRSVAEQVDALPAAPNASPAFPQEASLQASPSGRALATPPTAPRVGYAREARAVRSHRCRHLAHAVMAVGNLVSPSQMAANALALAVSVVMLVGLGDLRGILLPPPTPMVVGPVSRSPYHVWVNLDTRHPDAFSVVMESGFWANRRASVSAYGGPDTPVRAELRLTRVSGQQVAPEIEDGTVWVERRRRFLGREFAPGERVGRYSLSYLTRLHD